MGLRSEDQVLGYFAKVFAALGPEVPVCLQDYPQASGVYLSVDTLRKLFVSYPQLAVFKHEDCPSLPKLSRVRAVADDTGRQIGILTGNGGVYLPQELARGADGSMTGFAFPEMLVEVWKRFSSGDADGAEDLFDAYLPLLRHEAQPGMGLAIRKELLCRRGAIKSATVRQPGPVLDATDLKELDALVARLMRRVRTA
jgi:4-hydroxy-tetrahydrodipicolinate synthase